MARRRAVAAVAALLGISAALALLSAPALAWKPGPESYGMGERKNVPVQMEDSTVLRANVYYPTDPSTGGRETRARRRMWRFPWRTRTRSRPATSASRPSPASRATSLRTSR
jgi:hypothetical protein